MKRLILVLPGLEHEQQAREFINEFHEHNSKIHGTCKLEAYLGNYIEWVTMVDDYSKGINLPKGFVPGSTYFAFREEDNKLVGMTNIRHILTEDLLKSGGHIGYGVRPTERRKGYATEILYLALEKCKELGIDKALVTCDKNNIGSAKAIQNNFGIMENEITEESGAISQRYWVDVDYALTNIK